MHGSEWLSITEDVGIWLSSGAKELVFGVVGQSFTDHLIRLRLHHSYPLGPTTLLLRDGVTWVLGVRLGFVVFARFVFMRSDDICR